MNKIIVNTKFSVTKNKIKVEFEVENQNVLKHIESAGLFAESVKFDKVKTDLETKTIGFELKNYIEKLDSIHTKLYLKKSNKVIHLIEKKYQDKEYGSLLKKIEIDQNYIGIRSTVTKNDLVLSIVPIYEGGENEKIEYFNANHKKKNKKELVLFFEKRSETYGESSYQVFKKYHKINKNTRYILSKKNPGFDELKAKYGDFIIEKGSFEFFDALFNTKLLVSSELPANLITGKCIDMDIIEYINKIPFIFLQHGVFFAKPITSPSLRMFWKENIRYNLIKMVVSSELEKEELYKVGYKPSDLILTGLATLDEVDKTKEKKYCAYMPTYRNWEDLLVYNGRIKETTYYQDVLSMINIFKKLGKLDDLIVIPHPSYEGHIDYTNLFPGIKFKSYTSVRDELKLYITDFSSAGFDAQYRGASIMYYWNRRDDLERHYKVKSPINESNCNGIPVSSELDMYMELKGLYENNFELDPFYINNFKARMKFEDGKNSERIIEHIEEFLSKPNKIVNVHKQTLINDKSYFFNTNNKFENKLHNFYQNEAKLDDLPITKLINAEIRKNSIRFIFYENKSEEDIYLILIDRETKERLYFKLDKDKKIHKSVIKNFKAYYNMYLITVPEFGSIKKYCVKLELDFRNKKIYGKKKFIAIPRISPRIKYEVMNASLEKGFIRLYKHDGSYDIINLNPVERRKISISFLDYSHFIKSNNITIFSEEAQYQVKRSSDAEKQNY